MFKNIQKEELPRLSVYLPPDMERAIYADFLALAREAIDQATKNVTVNTRYLNQKELAEYFKCSTLEIRKWKAMGLKSFVKGKEIIFDLYDVNEFLNSIKS